MKKILDITLGIVTSIGGFLETGSIATAVQAGAAFGYQLGWAILLGTLAVAVLVEMSGRLAAISEHTIVAAIRERFGFRYYAVFAVVALIVTLMVLASEIGGMCLAMQMATGIAFHWWAIPMALLVWALLWFGTFSVVEKGASMLGLVTIVFLVAAVALHPHWGGVALGLVPSAPTEDRAQYWFLALSILGASVSPYLMIFYSSGAVEDKWDDSYLATNRAVSSLGMGFGGTLSMAILVVGAIVFLPRGIHIDKYEQVGVMLTPVLGRTGFVLFVLSLGVACLGAALEVALAGAYTLAQGLGWKWSENYKPATDARFSLTYTGIIFVAALPMFLGIDPLKLTMFSMSATAMSLPVAIAPMLLLLNDPEYIGEHGNGVLMNSAGIAIALLSVVVAVAAIPLQYLGG